MIAADISRPVGSSRPPNEAGGSRGSQAPTSFTTPSPSDSRSMERPLAGREKVGMFRWWSRQTSNRCSKRARVRASRDDVSRSCCGAGLLAEWLARSDGESRGSAPGQHVSGAAPVKAARFSRRREAGVSRRRRDRTARNILMFSNAIDPTDTTRLEQSIDYPRPGRPVCEARRAQPPASRTRR